MTVAELIEQLQQLDPTKEVMLKGYEGGFYSPTTIVNDFKIVKDYHDKDEWWYGPHESLDYAAMMSDATPDVVETVLIF